MRTPARKRGDPGSFHPLDMGKLFADHPGSMAGFLSEVYTADEVARAALVPRHAVEELLAGNGFSLTNGFLAPSAALALGRQLRAAAVAERVTDAPLFSTCQTRRISLDARRACRRCSPPRSTSWCLD